MEAPGAWKNPDSFKTDACEIVPTQKAHSTRFVCVHNLLHDVWECCLSVFAYFLRWQQIAYRLLFLTIFPFQDDRLSNGADANEMVPTQKISVHKNFAAIPSVLF